DAVAAGALIGRGAGLTIRLLRRAGARGAVVAAGAVAVDGAAGEAQRSGGVAVETIARRSRRSAAGTCAVPGATRSCHAVGAVLRRAADRAARWITACGGAIGHAAATEPRRRIGARRARAARLLTDRHRPARTFVANHVASLTLRGAGAAAAGAVDAEARS